MRHQSGQHTLAVLWITLVLTASSFLLEARTGVKPGFNIFTPQQDIEIGRASAQNAEKQLVLLNDPAADRYVTDIGKKLAAKSMNPNYPWTFKVVNDRAINAFALPGGFIYVNRGAIQSADNEAQIAGVIGHEIGHVVARHGTNQISKAIWPQVGLAMLGSLTAGRGGWANTLAQYGIPIGVNLYFLKNSREHEAQADLLGTQEITDAGYDPHQFASFFEKLERDNKQNISGAAAWFADHPSPANRVQSIDREIDGLNVPGQPIRDTTRFEDLKTHLRSLPPAPQPKPAGAGSKTTSSAGSAASQSANIPSPSENFSRFSARGNLYLVEYPSGWNVSAVGSGVSFWPEGGLQKIEERSDLVYGIQVSIFEPQGHGGHQDSLDAMTDLFVGNLLKGNNYLQEDTSGHVQMRVGNDRLLVTQLGGKPPYRPEDSTVRVATRMYDAHRLFAVVCIAPTDRFKEFEPAFRHVYESARFEF
ncbi:MAG: M48 family metallopeptidase [Acidobacteriia bacterium]|nr:M48 family metallopeptidase [Terriglobia bacterium]